MLNDNEKILIFIYRLAITTYSVIFTDLKVQPEFSVIFEKEYYINNLSNLQTLSIIITYLHLLFSQKSKTHLGYHVQPSAETPVASSGSQQQKKKA